MGNCHLIPTTIKKIDSLTYTIGFVTKGDNFVFCFFFNDKSPLHISSSKDMMILRLESNCQSAVQRCQMKFAPLLIIEILAANMDSDVFNF